MEPARRWQGTALASIPWMKRSHDPARRTPGNTEGPMEVRLNMMHGQSVSFCRVLMLLVLGATAMQAEAAAMAPLSMNGQTLSAEAGLKFEPGKAHLLRVVPDWARLVEDRITILVR